MCSNKVLLAIGYANLFTEKKNKPKNMADVDADEFLEETFFNELESDEEDVSS